MKKPRYRFLAALVLFYADEDQLAEVVVHWDRSSFLSTGQISELRKMLLYTEIYLPVHRSDQWAEEDVIVHWGRCYCTLRKMLLHTAHWGICFCTQFRSVSWGEQHWAGCCATTCSFLMCSWTSSGWQAPSRLSGWIDGRWMGRHLDGWMVGRLQGDRPRVGWIGGGWMGRHSSLLATTIS